MREPMLPKPLCTFGGLVERRPAAPPSIVHSPERSQCISIGCCVKARRRRRQQIMIISWMTTCADRRSLSASGHAGDAGLVKTPVAVADSRAARTGTESGTHKSGPMTERMIGLRARQCAKRCPREDSGSLHGQRQMSPMPRGRIARRRA